MVPELSFQDKQLNFSRMSLAGKAEKRGGESPEIASYARIPTCVVHSCIVVFLEHIAGSPTLPVSGATSKSPVDVYRLREVPSTKYQ